MKKQKHYTAEIIQIKDGWNFKNCKLIKYMAMHAGIYFILGVHLQEGAFKR